MGFGSVFFVVKSEKGVQDYFKETYGRDTHFIPNGVNQPEIREADYDISIKEKIRKCLKKLLRM